MRMLRATLFLLLSCLAGAQAWGASLAQTPLFVSNIAPPMNMLVVGRDQKLYFPAYNDASDIDGDGQLDTYYKPAIDYTGYFDSYKCYLYDALSGAFTRPPPRRTRSAPAPWAVGVGTTSIT
ncbi:MAG: hypothetical protein QM805_24175 [Pseudomonas sp.]